MFKYKFISRLATEKHVFKAVDVRTNEIVVLKMEDTNNEIHLLKNEAQMYVDLKNVEGVLDMKWYGNYGNYKYIALPFVETCLEDIIHCFSPSVLNTLANDLISVVHNVHSKYILHRDIKPSNFLISNNGKIFIIDFGFSKKFVDSKGLHIPEKKTQGLIGTATYASIRTLEDKIEPSRRDDMESLGYIFYEMYVKKKIFDKKQFLRNETIEDETLLKIQNYLKGCFHLNFFQKPCYEF